MMSEQSFKEENRTQTEEMFNKICPDEIYRRLINIFSELIAQYILINELTIKGFFTKCIRVWQIENNKSLSDLRYMPFEEQLFALITIFTFIKAELTRILIRPGQESKLDFAINECLDFYMRNFGLK